MERHSSPLALAALLIAALMTLEGCASSGARPDASSSAMADDEDQTNDPIEPVNRFVFDVNLKLDEYALKPVAKGYRAVFPEPVRNSVKSFLSNLGAPIVFMNDVLQADVPRANETLGRFVINTIFGLGGLFDFAADHDLPEHSNDFGLTLGHWGLPEGPYLMLPIFGPSNPRDTTGMIADSFADPFNIAASANHLSYLIYTRGAVKAIDSRSRTIELLDNLQRDSLDFYAAVRSFYRQRRASQIEHRASNDGPAGSAVAEAPEPSPVLEPRALEE